MSTFEAEQLQLATAILDRCRALHLHVATAESCSGGLISGCLTAIPGSSNAFDRGFVTYSNTAKTTLLGVPERLLARFGAVDESVARVMAEGALRSAGVDVAVAVTGIAGPDGGTAEKPVGLVHVAVARAGADTLHERHVFAGDREAVRSATVTAALKLLWRRLA
jgi:nicotinamide-nucleotide amidase